MDFVPFTLFFVVCLLNFQKCLAMPQLSAKSIRWPETCAGKTFCTDNSTYPSLESIVEALNLLDEDLSNMIPPTIDDRSSSDNTCKSKVTMDPIYFIRDDSDTPWYVVQVPGLFQFKIRIEECKNNRNPIGFDVKMKCAQVRTSIPFLVLSQDMTKVQSVHLKDGLPTACSPKMFDF